MGKNKLKNGPPEKRKLVIKKVRREASNRSYTKQITCGVCGGEEFNENLNVTKKLYCIYVCTTCTVQLIDKNKLKNLLGPYAVKNNLIADKVIFSMKFSMMDEFFDVIGVHNTGNKRKTRIKKRKSPKTSESDCKDNVLRDENSCKSDDSGDLSDHFQRYFDKNECINPKSESEREPVVSVKMEIDNFVCVESFMIKEEPQFLYSSEDDMPLLSLNKKNKNSTPPSQYNIDGDFQADKNVPINDLNDCSNFSNSSSVDFGPVSLNCDDNFLKSEPSLEDNVSKVEIKSKMTIEECLSRKKAEQFCDVCGKFFKQVNSFKLHMEDHEKGLSHKCDFCKQIFSTSIAKVKHMTKKHNYEACEMDAVKRLSYNCDDCNKIFKYEDLLIMHNMKHHREKCDEKTINSFTCPFCAKVCVKRFQLKRHVQEVHASKSFTCEICAKQFSRESILQAHMKTVHRVLKDRPTCEICGACFVTKYQLESHVVQQHSVKQETLMIGINDETKNPNNTKIQHVVAKNKNSTFKSNESKYICKYCGEDVGSDWKRRGHYEYIHDDGKKPMRSCKMCQLDFDSFTNFKAHIIAHNDPLICKICGEWCYTEVQLTNHTKGHTRIEKDQRKYECDICGVRSARKQHLVIHMRNHTGSCPFMCETCGRGFKFDSCYNYHKLKCAGRNIEKRFICQSCGKSFYSPHGLKEHERVHTNERPFECKICKSTFMTKAVLTHHHQTHDETRKKVRCDVCDRTFKFIDSLRAHDLKHHPEKFPFRCQICEKAFKNEGGVKAHMTAKHHNAK